MNENIFRNALVAGAERVTAWAGLLDRINVFPVADGDTGRNLVISLAPLRRIQATPEETARALLFSARGNAGNIAARFFHAFIAVDSRDKIPEGIRRGREQAWQAVGDPRPGTMLTFFDGLARTMAEIPEDLDGTWMRDAIGSLARVVLDTTAMLPKLERAGVVDSGALGMFLFFDGYLHALAGKPNELCDIASVFVGRLRIRDNGDDHPESGYCVDLVLSPRNGIETQVAALSEIGESLVVIRGEDYLKVHLHTPDRERVRRHMETFGNVIRWAEDDLEAQTAAFSETGTRAIQVMTDAAGSLTREHARSLGIVLLDSYINLGEQSLPESCLSPEMLYGEMRKGTPISTSQASVQERRQCYESAVSLYGKVLYLCVGSYFTGNYETALRWKTDHDSGGALTVIDTGCAGGRLGLLAAVTAAFSHQTADPEKVIAFAGNAISRCREYIFIDRLQYLAAGGRMSKTGAFFGDMIHMKPVISPQPDGAKKVGMVRNRRDQVAFALARLAEGLPRESRTAVWLEYTDNADWLESAVRPEIEKRFPQAEILIKPLSLTTGAHTGPGSWGIAFVTEASSS